MIQSRGAFVFGILVVAATAGLLGGFNLHWSRQDSFPLYGLLIDFLAVPALIYMIVYVRRLKAASTDEFAVAKKRMAAQTALVIGFALFAISGIFPIILPDVYNAFIASLEGENEAFIMGRVLGMAPFVVGLVIAQIMVWTRYR